MDFITNIFIFIIENIGFLFLSLILILLYYFISIEIKARYYLAIKKRMNELDK